LDDDRAAEAVPELAGRGSVPVRVVEEQSRRLVRGERDVVVEVLAGRDLDEDVVAVAAWIDLQAVDVDVREQALGRCRRRPTLGGGRRRHVVHEPYLDALARSETPGWAGDRALVCQRQDLAAAERRSGAAHLQRALEDAAFAVPHRRLAQRFVYASRRRRDEERRGQPGREQGIAIPRCKPRLLIPWRAYTHARIVARRSGLRPHAGRDDRAVVEHGPRFPDENSDQAWICLNASRI